MNLGAFSLIGGLAANRLDLGSDGSSTVGSWLAGGRYELGARTALRGSIARQVRFPTLRDLYDIDRGNADLDPERTMNYELGLQHLFASLPVVTELVLFRIDARDFIERLLGEPAMNMDEYRFQGVEITTGWRPADTLHIGFGDIWLGSENLSPNRLTDVQNRPGHKYTLTADYDASSGTSFRVEILRASDSYALSRTAPTTALRLEAYTTVNLVVSQSFRNDRVRVFARATNLLDENYVESLGFEQPGRTVYIGVDLSL